MTRPELILAALLLAVGCGGGERAPASSSPSAPAAPLGGSSAQPPATATPDTAAAPTQPPPPAAASDTPSSADKKTAQEPLADPRIEEIKKKYAEIQADKGLKKSEFRLACPGDEGSAEIRLHQKNNVVLRAELKDIAAGDAGSTYQFYYDNGALIFALNDAFPFGGPEATRLLQRRYYYHQGKPILCTKKVAEAPSDKVEALLNAAPSAPEDCSFAPKVQSLASLAMTGAKATDDLKKRLCPQPPAKPPR